MNAAGWERGRPGRGARRRAGDDAAPPGGHTTDADATRSPIAPMDAGAEPAGPPGRSSAMDVALTATQAPPGHRGGRRRLIGRLAVSCALLTITTGSVTMLTATRWRGARSDAGYISALRAAGVYDEFGAAAPALDNAQELCADLAAGDPAEGDTADRIGVEHFCPELAPDFVVTADVELDGRLTLFDTRYGALGDDEPCVGYGEVGDLQAGAEVVLETGAATIDRAELSRGRTWGASCVFRFALRVRGDAGRYRLRIGHEQVIELDRSELISPQGPVFLIGAE